MEDLGYTDNGLPEQVRDFSECVSVWQIMYEHFFPNGVREMDAVDWEVERVLCENPESMYARL